MDRQDHIERTRPEAVKLLGILLEAGDLNKPLRRIIAARQMDQLRGRLLNFVELAVQDYQQRCPELNTIRRIQPWLKIKHPGCDYTYTYCCLFCKTILGDIGDPDCFCPHTNVCSLISLAGSVMKSAAIISETFSAGIEQWRRNLQGKTALFEAKIEHVVLVPRLSKYLRRVTSRRAPGTYAEMVNSSPSAHYVNGHVSSEAFRVEVDRWFADHKGKPTIPLDAKIEHVYVRVTRAPSGSDHGAEWRHTAKGRGACPMTYWKIEPHRGFEA